MWKFIFVLITLCCGWAGVYAQDKDSSPILISDGLITLVPDSLGNRMPDYSYAGYAAGESEVPTVDACVFVPHQSHDATQVIQSAIDYVATLPLNKDGFRGAVLLDRGTFIVSGSLHIYRSGVVLRGSGFVGESTTTLIGEGLTRETLISVHGKDVQAISPAVDVKAAYVPVGSQSIDVEDASAFNIGDGIFINRPSTQEWIDVLGTAHFGGGITSLGWKPGRRDIVLDRKIVRINGNSLELDAPLTVALDKKFGGANVSKYTWNERISHVGVENMKLLSSFDAANRKDEDHRWMAISLNNVEDAWVRRVEFRHFAGSAVFVQDKAKRITVEDCISLAPISEIGGSRRRTFFSKGEQVLFQRLHSEGGIHDFAVGYLAAGPNVFVQCYAEQSHSFSGTVDSWASAVLFDNVEMDGQALSYRNRGQDGQGAGWTAANSTFWQCSAARVDCYQPPTAQNWAFGIWAQFQGDGYWEKSNEHIKPRSLYYALLQERLGTDLEARAGLMPKSLDASSSPSIDVASALTKNAVHPQETLYQFILDRGREQNVDASFEKVHRLPSVIADKADQLSKKAMALMNGWIVSGERVIVGGKTDVPWWTGTARSYGASKSKPHITRFVPGEYGPGLTDELDSVVRTMKRDNILSIDHNYGLWYDRRRDDHERVRRIDGEVWAPFYELPFARSGEGLAYDGLSKYDLTKYNQFYWGRLRQFADLADREEVVLLHQNYFQHNILEAGAHYAEFPWRTANNINEVGFPEPAPYAGDKRIFMAEQFYDITHPVRREIHRAYIRQCLDNFKNNTHVIQFISAEYTGPLHFVQFWIDVIKEWEEENGVNATVALSTTKDVQDAILDDPIRASVIDVIDIRYWHYQADGSLYAPEGGKNLAPRQHARLLRPKKTSSEQVYRAVQEYKSRFPEKAVIYFADNYPSMGWASFLAGGSMANVPQVADNGFYVATAKMKPSNRFEQWLLEGAEGCVILLGKGEKPKIDFSTYRGAYKIQLINADSGQINETFRVKKLSTFDWKLLDSNRQIVWIQKV